MNAITQSWKYKHEFAQSTAFANGIWNFVLQWKIPFLPELPWRCRQMSSSSSAIVPSKCKLSVVPSCQHQILKLPGQQGGSWSYRKGQRAHVPCSCQYEMSGMPLQILSQAHTYKVPHDVPNTAADLFLMSPVDLKWQEKLEPHWR